jgi:hypothetical protein
MAEVKTGRPQPKQTNTPGRFSLLTGCGTLGAFFAEHRCASAVCAIGLWIILAQLPAATGPGASNDAIFSNASTSFIEEGCAATNPRQAVKTTGENAVVNSRVITVSFHSCLDTSLPRGGARNFRRLQAGQSIQLRLYPGLGHRPTIAKIIYLKQVEKRMQVVKSYCRILLSQRCAIAQFDRCGVIMLESF